MTAEAGGITAVLGANGAGKSSLMRAVSGIAPVAAGQILLDGQDITGLPPPARAKLGLAHAMEGRRLFRQLAVEDNLKLAWSFGARGTKLPTALVVVIAEQMAALALKVAPGARAAARQRGDGRHRPGAAARQGWPGAAGELSVTPALTPAPNLAGFPRTTPHGEGKVA